MIIYNDTHFFLDFEFMWDDDENEKRRTGNMTERESNFIKYMPENWRPSIFTPKFDTT